MNGRSADALLARVFADIAVFAAVTEDDHSFALERGFIRELNSAQGGVVQRRLSAISQVFELSEKDRPVRRVVDHQAHAVIESNEGDRVIRTQGIQVTARGRQRFRQGLVRHAAAGINHQDAGESQVVIGDVLDARDICQAGQIATHGEVFHLQPGDQLPAGIQDAGVNGDF